MDDIVHASKDELVFTNWSLSSKFDIAAGDIKYPAIGIIDAIGPVCYDEIRVRIRVPRPKGVTTFHQITNHMEFSRRESVAAIAARALRTGLI